jgi:hypothetical protein
MADIDASVGVDDEFREARPPSSDRRIVVRDEHYPETFLEMLHIACRLILMRSL